MGYMFGLTEQACGCGCYLKVSFCSRMSRSGSQKEAGDLRTRWCTVSCFSFMTCWWLIRPRPSVSSAFCHFPRLYLHRHPVGVWMCEWVIEQKTIFTRALTSCSSHLSWFQLEPTFHGALWIFHTSHFHNIGLWNQLLMLNGPSAGWWCHRGYLAGGVRVERRGQQSGRGRTAVGSETSFTCRTTNKPDCLKGSSGVFQPGYGAVLPTGFEPGPADCFSCPLWLPHECLGQLTSFTEVEFSFSQSLTLN